MKGILFLCTGNSCRSQMAEGFARRIAPADLRVYSAGTEPVGVNPRAIAAMAEAGIDIHDQRSKSIDDVPLGAVDTVVTLCGDAAERCPSLPAGVTRIHWGLPDPARASGSEAEITAVFHRVRDEIERRVRGLLGAEG